MTAKEAKAYLKLYRESLEQTQEITDHLAELKAEAERLRDHEGQSIQLDAAVARYIDAIKDDCGFVHYVSTDRQDLTAASIVLLTPHVRSAAQISKAEYEAAVFREVHTL